MGGEAEAMISRQAPTIAGAWLAMAIATAVSAVYGADAAGQEARGGESGSADRKTIERILGDVLGASIPAPDDVHAVRRAADGYQRALRDGPEPKEITANPLIRLDAAERPPAVEGEPGYITTLGFFDATGAPWPIADLLGAGEWDVPKPQEGAHIVRMKPNVVGARGNISVQLVGLATPVVLTLHSGAGKVHSRYDARISKNGPNAVPAMIARRASVTAGSEALLRVLAGASPDGGVPLELTVGGGGGSVDGERAWKVGDTLWLRGPLELLAPGFTDIQPSEGVTVYTLPWTPLIYLWNGANDRVKVKLSPRRQAGGGLGRE
jgi:intracellular multiplication protein IcmK